MTRIRSLAPEKCPTCGAEHPFRLIDGVVRCVRCGQLANAAEKADPDAHITDAELEALFGDEATAPDFTDELQRRRESYRPSFIVRHRDKSEIDVYADAIFSTAMSHVERKEWDEAIRNFRRAIDHFRDFTDAHLWLSRLLPDEADRRQHLKSVLAADMNHGDALRELMILDGELDADHVPDDFTMPESRTAESVDARSRGVKCLRCGAPKLDSDPLRPGLMTCGACGHEVAAAMGGGDRNIARAMLKRRAQAVVWTVGARVLRCNGCGAQRTFAADQLAELCPFCGSRNVITQDALNTLAQPDSVVPFAISEQQASDAVRAALASGFERVKGWFIDNRAYRIMAEGVYLPYWVFDAAVDVTRTYIIRDDSQRRSRSLLAPVMPSMTDKFGDAAYNVLIPGVGQPPAWLLARIGKFDVGSALAYTPEVIAQHAAEIYTRDFDKALMDAHTVISHTMREKYSVNTPTEETLSVSALVKPISFRLVLLPVWALTVHERDGDVRPALVNGQSGQVAFGKAVKGSEKK